MKCKLQEVRSEQGVQDLNLFERYVGEAPLWHAAGNWAALTAAGFNYGTTLTLIAN